MFNYIKETIINDVANQVAKYSTATDLIVKRAGNYKFANIVDKKVFRAPGVEGECASLVAKVNPLIKDAIYRFTMFISTPGKQLADYAYPNWGEFGKVVFVEFAGNADAEKDAAALENALKLALQPDNALYKVEREDDEVTITFVAPWMKIAEYTLEAYNEIEDKYIPAADIEFTKEDNVADFATADWLVENLRFPSYPNRRFAPLYADESPVAGEVYDQYAFQYCVKHAVPGGLSAVGQVVDSETSHVFYVKHANAAAFEALFKTGGCTIVASPLE